MNKTVLITGGSSGIGLELSRLFLADGYQLIIASLLADELSAAKQTFGEQLRTIQIDLSRPDAAQTLYDKTHADNISILVNCAGLGLYGEHTEIDYAMMQNMLAVNMTALTELCTLFAHNFKQRGSGHILNIGSTSAIHPIPYLAAYAASKAFVVSFSKALAVELEPHGITVSCLCPGTTQTAFIDKAGIYNNKLLASLVNRVAMSPQQVARVGYNALLKKSTHVTPGITNKLHTMLGKLLPHKLLLLLTAKIFRPHD